MGLFDWLKRKDETIVRFRERTDIPVPDLFSGIDMEELYCRCYSGFFAGVADGVEADLWNRELGGNYVTLILDRYLEGAGIDRGRIYITAWGNCNTGNYITLRNIDLLSSGIRYCGSFRYQNKDVAMLDVDRNMSRKCISIPDDVMVGFDWGANEYDDKACSWNEIPVDRFGGDVVLNFAASGEFNLTVFFERVSDCGASGSKEVIATPLRLDCLFSKNFCCK